MDDLKTVRKIRMLFKEILAASNGMNEEEVQRLYKTAKASGVDLEIKTKESTKWDVVDGVKYATVTQRSQLMFGGVVVSKWSGIYCGTYGCMGTGWWVEEMECSGCDDGVEELMEACEIYPESPAVPEPIRIDGL